MIGCRGRRTTFTVGGSWRRACPYLLQIEVTLFWCACHEKHSFTLRCVCSSVCTLCVHDYFSWQAHDIHRRRVLETRVSISASGVICCLWCACHEKSSCLRCVVCSQFCVHIVRRRVLFVAGAQQTPSPGLRDARVQICFRLTSNRLVRLPRKKYSSTLLV